MKTGNNPPTVWAISDTHLSFARQRDQTRFGQKWRNHEARIAEAWRERVASTDIVLMPGDLSWAHTPRNVVPDLAWLNELPGRKILVRGNHDYWWKKLTQIEQNLLHRLTYAVQGTCLSMDDLLICGTMGHIAPNDPYYQKRKYKSYKRELNWLTDSLRSAHAMRQNGEPILLMMHYPPLTSDGLPSGFTEVIREYQPDICVYGHLHFATEWEVALDDTVDYGTRYHLVPCDYLDMIPRKVWPPSA